MPHLIANYSENIKHLDVKTMLVKLNEALFSTGFFETYDEIKSRGQCDHHVVIGLDNTSQAYVHIKLYILSGRTIEQRKQLSKTLLETAEKQLNLQSNQLSLQVCVEIAEIERESYSKVVIASK